MEQSQLVKDFVESYYKAQQHLDASRVDSARKQYYLLLDIYSKLMKTNMDEFQRELAYDQITKVFNRIKEVQKGTTKMPLNIIVAGVLIIVFSIIVALNPGIVGLTTFQDEISQPVTLVFENTTVSTGMLKQVPLSFAISGKFEGESAKVFLEHKEQLVLVFDTEQVALDDEGKFTKSCLDTCTLNDFEGVVAKLFVEVINGRLEVNELIYHIERTENQPPEWIGESKDFAVKGKTIIDLSKQFKDPEGDELVFLSTTEDGIDIRVERNQMIIIPKAGVTGDKIITVIASDLGKLTKIPITLKVS